MEYEWDAAKNAANRRKHGIGFEAMERFDWNKAASFLQNERGEERELVIAPIDQVLFTAIVTERAKMRVISLRPASKSEKRMWRKVMQDE